MPDVPITFEEDIKIQDELKFEPKEENEEFDAFTDGASVHRKYKLRNVVKKRPVGPRRRVSYSQLEALWEALYRNRSLATGYNKTAQARELSRQMWMTVAQTINSLGDGATKDWKGWCKYWNDYKLKLKSRVASARASLHFTGGGPSNEQPLTELEQKFLQIVVEDFGSGIPNARVNPIDDAPPVDHQSQQGSESLLSQWPNPALLTEGDGEKQQHPTPTLPPAAPLPAMPRRSLRLMARRAGPAAPAGPSTRAAPSQNTPGTPPPRQHSTPRPRTPALRQRRGEPPMTQQAAREALVADSRDRTTLSREKLDVIKILVEELREIKNILNSRSNTIPVHKQEEEYHKDIETFDCEKCRKTFYSKTGLLNHTRIHKVIQKFTCAICQEVFHTNTELINHKTVHKTEDRVFLCKFCKMAFTNHLDYLMHDFSHTNNKLYKCIECQLYKKKKAMKKHILTHYENKHECLICNKKYRTEQFLKIHVDEVHDKKNHAECGECGRMISSGYRKRHMATHTGVKKIQCFYCGETFFDVHHRDLHTRKHTGERPFTCDICNKGFIDTNTLKCHLLTHDKSKPFKCEVCGKRFRDSHQRKQHAKLHSEKEAYNCPVCDKPYQNRQCLTAHMLYVHSTERNFKCDVCNMSFKDQRSVVRHNKSKTHQRAAYGKQEMEE